MVELLASVNQSVDQAGLERTEAGESAPSRLEDSPRPGRAKCELCETLQDLIMGAGEEASINLPCLLILAPSWMLGLPSPTRPSWRRRRGGHCANRPFCHSDEARDREERITWSCATKRPVSGLSASCSPTIFLGAGEVGRAGVEGLEACREISGLPGPSSAKFGFRGGRIFITPIKNLPSRWEVVAECLKEGAMGPGRGTRSRREGEKQIHRQNTQTNS